MTLAAQGAAPYLDLFQTTVGAPINEALERLVRMDGGRTGLRLVSAASGMAQSGLPQPAAATTDGTAGTLA